MTRAKRPTGVFQHSAKLWRTGLHAALMLLSMLTFLSQGPVCDAQELPRVVLQCLPDSQPQSKPFKLCVSVSWEGNAESNVIVTPEPVFPKSFTLRSSSFEAAVSESRHQLTYCFTLIPKQTGSFTIYPVEVHFWPRGSKTEASLLTNQCIVTIGGNAKITRRKTLAAIAISVLLIIAAGMYMLKKRTGATRTKTQPSNELHSAELVQLCRQKLLQGDYTNFYTTALKAARALMPADTKLHSRIETSLEHVRFSRRKPSAEEANQILHQLERMLTRGKQV